MQKKDDKMGNKTADKEGKKKQERTFEIDSQKIMRMREVSLVGNMPFFPCKTRF